MSYLDYTLCLDLKNKKYKSLIKYYYDKKTDNKQVIYNYQKLLLLNDSINIFDNISENTYHFLNFLLFKNRKNRIKLWNAFSSQLTEENITFIINNYLNEFNNDNENKNKYNILDLNILFGNDKLQTYITKYDNFANLMNNLLIKFDENVIIIVKKLIYENDIFDKLLLKYLYVDVNTNMNRHIDKYGNILLLSCHIFNYYYTIYQDFYEEGNIFNIDYIYKKDAITNFVEFSNRYELKHKFDYNFCSELLFIVLNNIKVVYKQFMGMNYRIFILNSNSIINNLNSYLPKVRNIVNNKVIKEQIAQFFNNISSNIIQYANDKGKENDNYNIDACLSIIIENINNDIIDYLKNDFFEFCVEVSNNKTLTKNPFIKFEFINVASILYNAHNINEEYHNNFVLNNRLFMSTIDNYFKLSKNDDIKLYINKIFLILLTLNVDINTLINEDSLYIIYKFVIQYCILISNEYDKLIAVDNKFVNLYETSKLYFTNMHLIVKFINKIYCQKINNSQELSNYITNLIPSIVNIINKYYKELSSKKMSTVLKRCSIHAISEILHDVIELSLKMYNNDVKHIINNINYNRTIFDNVIKLNEFSFGHQYYNLYYLLTTYSENNDATYDANNLPDEFLDNLLYTEIFDPVCLPNVNNTFFDKSTIITHLLINETNPINGGELTIKEFEEYNKSEKIIHEIEDFKTRKSKWIIENTK